MQNASICDDARAADRLRYGEQLLVPPWVRQVPWLGRNAHEPQWSRQPDARARAIFASNVTVSGLSEVPTKCSQSHSSFTFATQCPAPSVQRLAFARLATTSATKSVHEGPPSIGGAASLSVASGTSRSSASVASRETPPSEGGETRVVQSKHAPRLEAVARRIATRAAPRGWTFGDTATHGSIVTMRAWAAAVLLSGCLVGAVAPSVARADSPSRGETKRDDAARLAYERGLRAHAVGDHLAAARAFLDADRAVPSDEAMEAALDAALRADDPVLGMALVARASARNLDPRASAARDKARVAFASRVARLVVACEAAVYCHVRVDAGEDVDAREPLFVVPGPHTVRVTADARSFAENVAVTAGSDVTVRAPRDGAPGSSVPFAPAAPNDDGVRPGRVVVVVGASVTGVLTAFTIASAVDLFTTRGVFRDERCGADASPLTVPGATCTDLAADGKAAELRTGVLLGSTVATLLATIATELFFVPPRATKAALRTTPLKVRVAIGETRVGVALELPVP